MEPQDCSLCQTSISIPLSVSIFLSPRLILLASLCSGQITGVALGVPASLIFCLAMFFLGVLYHRGLAIRRKRAMRRYLESGEVGLQRLCS